MEKDYLKVVLHNIRWKKGCQLFTDNVLATFIDTTLIPSINYIISNTMLHFTVYNMPLNVHLSL